MDDRRKQADEQSWNATSRLYNWHICCDDGLWLDDGNTSVTEVRFLQQNPWIINHFDSSDQDDPPAEEKGKIFG